ncbi:MAG: hypothetical protein Q9170_004467 [Blastenia crenularia]
MSPSAQASDHDATLSHSEKSNAWTLTQRDDIYNRRQKGENWETIWLVCIQARFEIALQLPLTQFKDYPSRSKHAMQQQYSTTPVKPNRIPRRASTHVLSSVVNGVDRHQKGGSSMGLDGADSEDATDDAKRISTRKSRSGRLDHDQPVSPKRRKSAPQQRLSKRLNDTAKDQTDDEREASEEPVSARPKRTKASGINYNLLLQNSDYDEIEEPAVAVAAGSPKRKSKIITLRTNPSKTLLGSILDEKMRKTRKTASVDGGREASKLAIEKEVVSPKRKSARVKKAADDSLANGENTSSNQPGGLRTPRKRKPRLLSHLDIVERSTTPPPASEPSKKSRKRKRSKYEEDETGLENEELTHDKESESPEKKKRRVKQKIKGDLGFLANGQPRQRRRRRTRQEMLLDQQTPKTVTTRRRGKYQFPNLEGYNGPTPPDVTNTPSHQNESERKNSASDSTSDHDTAPSVMSLNEDSSPLESSPEPNHTFNDTDYAKSRPNLDPPLSGNSLVSPGQPPAMMRVDQPATDDPEAPLSIPDVVFFPEDLAKGRENAIKLRAAYEADQKSQLTTSEASHAQQSQRITELQQEMVNVREGLTTRLNSEKQEHVREMSTLKASEDEMRSQLERSVEDGANTLQISQDGMQKKFDADLAAELEAKDRVFASAKEAWEGVQKKLEDMLESKKMALVAKEEELKAKEEELRAKSRALIQQEALVAVLEKNRKVADLDAMSPKKAVSTTNPPSQKPSQPPTTYTQSSAQTDPPQPSNIPSTNNQLIRPLLSSLRNAHIRLAGHIKQSKKSHHSLSSGIAKLNTDLEEDEITMRGVRKVVQELVSGVGGVGRALEGAREASEECKGEVMALMDAGGV